jgi:hypothetical protein
LLLLQNKSEPVGPFLKVEEKAGSGPLQKPEPYRIALEKLLNVAVGELFWQHGLFSFLRSGLVGVLLQERVKSAFPEF